MTETVRLPIQVENKVVRQNYTSLIIVTNTKEGSVNYEVRTDGIPTPHVYGCFDGSCAVAKYQEVVMEQRRGL